MQTATRTKTRTEIINNFLKENELSSNDLARYLEEEHDFACYKDDQYDN